MHSYRLQEKMWIVCEKTCISKKRWFCSIIICRVLDIESLCHNYACIVNWKVKENQNAYTCVIVSFIVVFLFCIYYPFLVESSIFTEHSGQLNQEDRRLMSTNGRQCPP